MRKQIRTKLLATCLAAIAVATMTGCKSQPTHEFTPAEEPAISQSQGSPMEINNQGRFQYKLDEEKYNELVKKSTPAGVNTLTGHQVYVDAQGSMFIISGYEKVELKDGYIPESAWGSLREEGSGMRLFVQSGVNEDAEDQLVTNWVTAWKAGSAAVSAAKNGSYNGKIIVINNRILDTRTGNVDPHYEDGVAYIPAVSLLSEAGNITMVDVEGSMVQFNVQTSKGTKGYIVNYESPNMVVSEDGTEALTAETPLIYEAKGVIYIDPVAMADVFDWEVNGYGKIFEGKSGLLEIVTDATYAGGHAVAGYGCKMDIREDESVNAEDKGVIEEVQEDLDKQAAETQKLLEGKEQELQDLRKELEDQEGLTPEQIDEKIQERSDEIDEEIDKGTYDPQAPSQPEQQPEQQPTPEPLPAESQPESKPATPPPSNGDLSNDEISDLIDSIFGPGGTPGGNPNVGTWG